MSNQLTRSKIFQPDGKILDVPVYNWNPVQGCAMKGQCPVDRCWAAGECRRWAAQWAEAELKYRGAKLLRPENSIFYRNLKQFELQWFESQYQKQFPKNEKPVIVLVGWRSDIARWLQGWKQTIVNKIVVDNAYRDMMGWKKHIFLFLTKWPSLAYTVDMPENCWLGATYIDFKNNVDGIPYFLDLGKDNKTFVFLEPLKTYIPYENLKELTIGEWSHYDDDTGDICTHNSYPVSWVVCGGGDGVPLNPDWVRPIRDRCKEEKIPFWYKQLGDYFPYWCPHDHVYKFEKSKRAKRANVFDGRIYHEIPDFWENL